jgi:hypothetical protein
MQAFSLICREPTAQQLPPNNSFDVKEAARLFLPNISVPIGF